MIKNDNQRSTAERKLENLRAMLREPLAEADSQHYEEKAEELASEIARYESAARGELGRVRIRDLSELGEVLILARIAQGWTQKDLAKQLGVHAQQVQRWEDRSYEQAALWRCADVADVLELDLEGWLEPAGDLPAMAGQEARIGNRY